MRIYLIKDSDIEHLREKLGCDPRDGINRAYGYAKLTPEQQEVADRAQRFYSHNIENWLEGVMRGDDGTTLR